MNNKDRKTVPDIRNLEQENEKIVPQVRTCHAVNNCVLEAQYLPVDLPEAGKMF
jgi:hypothetical protein